VSTIEEHRRDAENALWELVGSVRWAMERGVFDGAPEHLVESIEGHFRRIDAYLQPPDIQETEAGSR
jgi:hypothetical protein